jgi:phosphorylcholine metabolism protein LicD
MNRPLLKKIKKNNLKILVYYDTICYTYKVLRD